MLSRRAALKWLHWLSFGLIIYFFFVEPDENRADPGGALSTHAGVGLVLAIVVLIWTVMYLRRGLASRPGPKLPALGKRLHPIMHKALYIGMPVMLATGAISGLAAPFLIRAFGTVPINLSGGSKSLHDIATEIHEIVFDGLIILIIAHAVFHIWRHVRLKDNALRIMVPRPFHKWL